MSWLIKFLLAIVLTCTTACTLLARNFSLPELPATQDSSIFKKNFSGVKHTLGFYMTNGRSPIVFNNPSLILINNTTLPFRSFGAFNELFVNYNFKPKDNLFFEAGLRYTTIFHGFTVNQWLVSVQGSSQIYNSAYGQFVFNLGAGYKININQKRNIFDVQAGFIAGFTDQQKGAGQVFFDAYPYTDASNNSGTFAITSKYRIQNAGFWGFYYGISKEVKVTKNLYVSMMYNLQLGLSTISEHTFQYGVSELGIENTVSGLITARSRVLGLGLKWHFVR